MPRPSLIAPLAESELKSLRDAREKQQRGRKALELIYIIRKKRREKAAKNEQP